MNLPILESFFDKPFIAGYSLASIFQYWWVGLIIIIVAAVALVGAYFLLNWLFGRMKFKEGDKEALKAYDEAPRAEKKEAAKAAQGPVKNVITWKRMRGWLIPVVCVVALLSSAAASFLPSNAFQNLLTTLKGSAVAIVDTPTSKEAAAQAEKNVVSIQEEGTVLLKNKNNALPINLETNKKVNIFGSCAFGLFYGNGGSGSFQTDGRVKSFPRTALKLEQAMKDEGFEINENIFNMIKNYYSSNKKTTDEDIQKLKDLPIWFIHAANDTTVNPKNFVIPTYQRLADAGAKDLHFSYFVDVRGTDGNPQGNNYQGHYSWIYIFRDEVALDQIDPANVAAPSTEVVKDAQGNTVNLFDWMESMK